MVHQNIARIESTLYVNVLFLRVREYGTMRFPYALHGQ